MSALEPPRPPSPRPPQPTPVTLFVRAMRLRCPRCGEGRLFAAFFRMNPVCTSCRLKFERAPGYFLGSTYINYGVTAVAVTVVYIVLHVGGKLTNRALAAPLAGFCVLFPLYFFRYARSLWLAMDYLFDPGSFPNGEE